MKSIPFAQANRILKAPEQTDEQKERQPISDLPVHFDNATGRWMSIWMPSAEELEILNNGGGIAAMVMGPQHPPIYIGAADLDFKEGDFEEGEPVEEPKKKSSIIQTGGGIIL